jgi:hypothetical protein
VFVVTKESAYVELEGFYEKLRKSMISVQFGPWESACGTTSEMPNGPQFNRSGSQFNRNKRRKPVLRSSKLCKCATIHSTRHAILGSYSRAHIQTSTNPTLKPLKKLPHLKTSTMVALIYVGFKVCCFKVAGFEVPSQQHPSTLQAQLSYKQQD